MGVPASELCQNEHSDLDVSASVNLVDFIAFIAAIKYIYHMKTNTGFNSSTVAVYLLIISAANFAFAQNVYVENLASGYSGKWKLDTKWTLKGKAEGETKNHPAITLEYGEKKLVSPLKKFMGLEYQAHGMVWSYTPGTSGAITLNDIEKAAPVPDKDIVIRIESGTTTFYTTIISLQDSKKGGLEVAQYTVFDWFPTVKRKLRDQYGAEALKVKSFDEVKELITKGESKDKVVSCRDYLGLSEKVFTSEEVNRVYKTLLDSFGLINEKFPDSKIAFSWLKHARDDCLKRSEGNE